MRIFNTCSSISSCFSCAFLTIKRCKWNRKLRDRPKLDPRFLEGADADAFRKGASAADEDPESWRTDASETFDRIRGRSDEEIRSLSLAFYEKAVVAGTVAPVGDDEPSTMLGGSNAGSTVGGSNAGGESGELSGRALELASRMDGTQRDGASAVSSRNMSDGASSYSADRTARDRPEDSVGNDSSLFSKLWDSNEPVPSYGEAVSTTICRGIIHSGS